LKSQKRGGIGRSIRAHNQNISRGGGGVTGGQGNHRRGPPPGPCLRTIREERGFGALPFATFHFEGADAKGDQTKVWNLRNRSNCMFKASWTEGERIGRGKIALKGKIRKRGGPDRTDFSGGDPHRERGRAQ